MRKRYGVILAVIGYIVSFSCMEGWGADWKFVARDVQDNVWEIDVETISHQHNNVVRVWVKTTYSPKGVDDFVKDLGEEYKECSYGKSLVEVLCTKKRIRTLQFVSYSSDGVVIKIYNRPSELDFIIPESPGEATLKQVCK